MAYFIFTKNSDNLESSIYKIAENESDLNNLNLSKSEYKIIEDSDANFQLVRLGKKFPLKYQNNTITYIFNEPYFLLKDLENYIQYFKNLIKNYLEYNKNHSLYTKWNNYYNQLDSLNLNSFTFPFEKSLEEYFKDANQTYLNPLQLP